MSALGQKQKFAPQKVMSALPTKAEMCSATRDVRSGPIADSCSATTAPLFDQLVGAQDETGGDNVVHCLGSLEIDHQLELARLLNRQIAGLGTTKNFNSYSSPLAVNFDNTRTIANQTPLFGCFRPLIDRRQSQLGRTFDDGATIPVQHRRTQHVECYGTSRARIIHGRY